MAGRYKTMKTICTKCKSEDIVVVPREKKKEPETQTMDEMVENMFGMKTLVYHPTTWVCKSCGYEVTR